MLLSQIKILRDHINVKLKGFLGRWSRFLVHCLRKQVTFCIFFGHFESADKYKLYVINILVILHGQKSSSKTIGELYLKITVQHRNFVAFL